MGSSLINIGLSALNAAQAGLNTAGHNISNAATPGYTRQQTLQTASTPIFTGGGFIGQGTDVASVQRVYSDFLTTQVMSAQSRQSQLTAYDSQITKVDNLLGDAKAGLSPALQSFFTGVQGLTSNPGSNPSSIPSRQAFISSAQSLTSRFASLNDNLNQTRNDVNSQLQTTVSSISAYASQIAELNQRISSTEAGGMGQPANDLRDQRDQLLASLSQQINISTSVASDGSRNVFVGNGIALVLGSQAYTMNTTTSPSDQSSLSVGLQGPGGQTVALPDSQLTGGTLGGLIAFRNETLNPTQNKLGQVALTLGETFNNQHMLGQDLNGNMGKALFSFGPVSVQPSGTNNKATASGLVNVSYDSATATNLTASDYQVSFDGSAYQITRLSDGANVGSNLTPPATQTVDGLSFTLNQGKVSAGDSFMVQPTRNAAGALAVALSDPNLIAAASPLGAAAKAGNSGSGSISISSLSSTSNLPLATSPTGDITLNYNAAAKQFTVSGPAALGLPATLAYNPATQSTGASFTFSSVGGVSFSMSGVPGNGDTFTLKANTQGTSDNFNALALGKLQTTNIMSGGKATYQSAYAQIVGIVGNTANDTAVNLSAQNSMVTQLQTSQQSQSGVNLDEEAANLIRFQQAYQAAGKVISVAQKLFDQILTL